MSKLSAATAGRRVPAVPENADRKSDWSGAKKDIPLTIRSSSAHAGVSATLGEIQCSIYNTFPVCAFEMSLPAADGRRFGDLIAAARPGEIVAQRDGAVCRHTDDGALWIVRAQLPGSFKRRAIDVLSQAGADVSDVPEVRLPLDAPKLDTFQEVRIEVADGIGWLHFNICNGAMSADRLARLTRAFRLLELRKAKVIVLMNDEKNHWSNGIDLAKIHGAADPENETMLNLQAINDLIRVIRSSSSRTIAAVNNHAGAGGVFLALGCDYVFARSTVVFNPHYLKMGLTGSEFHTLTLPDRVGRSAAKKLLEECQPLNARSAQEIGLVDDIRTEAFRIGLKMRPATSFEDGIRAFAAHALQRDDRYGLRKHKHTRVAAAKFSAEMDAAEERELAEMRECVYDNRYGYREKRTAFVG